MEILATVIEEEYDQDGEIPAGFLFASVKNVGNSTALVNGVELLPNEAKTYPFVGKGCAAVPYQVQGSTLRIMYYK